MSDVKPVYVPFQANLAFVIFYVISMLMNQKELENRLVDFACLVIQMAEQLPKSYVSIHLGKQIIRSSTSVALNYGEARAAESRADFSHKVKLALKELCETDVCLRIIRRTVETKTDMEPIQKESGELKAILTATVKSLKRKS